MIRQVVDIIHKREASNICQIHILHIRRGIKNNLHEFTIYNISYIINYNKPREV